MGRRRNRAGCVPYRIVALCEGLETLASGCVPYSAGTRLVSEVFAVMSKTLHEAVKGAGDDECRVPVEVDGGDIVEMGEDLLQAFAFAMSLSSLASV